MSLGTISRVYTEHRQRKGNKVSKVILKKKKIKPNLDVAAEIVSFFESTLPWGVVTLVSIKGSEHLGCIFICCVLHDGQPNY